MTVVGENHAPIAGQKWNYRVTVTGPEGVKPDGTETTHYTAGGAVVGTEKPVNVPFKHGTYRDTIEFPAAAAGYPLMIEAVVKTSIGSATAGWSVTVKK